MTPGNQEIAAAVLFSHKCVNSRKENKLGNQEKFVLPNTKYAVLAFHRKQINNRALVQEECAL